MYFFLKVEVIKTHAQHSSFTLPLKLSIITATSHPPGGDGLSVEEWALTKLLPHVYSLNLLLRIALE